jgi:hypothetical protein
MIASLPRALDIPVVETERLRLRGHTLDDFAHTRALWGDAAVVTYMGGKPFTSEECWTRFLRYFGHWSVLGFGYWVVEEKATGDFVGEVGFGNRLSERSLSWAGSLLQRNTERDMQPKPPRQRCSGDDSTLARTTSPASSTPTIERPSRLPESAASKSGSSAPTRGGRPSFSNSPECSFAHAFC